MKTCIAAIVFVAVFPAITSAEKLLIKSTSPAYVPAKRKPTQSTPEPSIRTWIPAGKFGLVLGDGTRIIGVPSKRWPATLKTRFGRVTIPRDQISRIETVAGEVRVDLRNGDSISGMFLSETMVFETHFGRLTFPVKAMVRLSARRSQQSRRAATIASLMPRLKGNWVVTYTNKTRHPRTIHENKLVNDGDELVRKNGDLLILFPTVIERITLIDDKLFVEHFNPRSTYPNGIPAVMGVGRRSK